MVTIASSGSSTLTWIGSDCSLMNRVKFSLLSNIASSVTGKLNRAFFCPAGILTEYGPES